MSAKLPSQEVAQEAEYQKALIYDVNLIHASDSSEEFNSLKPFLEELIARVNSLDVCLFNPLTDAVAGTSVFHGMCHVHNQSKITIVVVSMSIREALEEYQTQNAALRHMGKPTLIPVVAPGVLKKDIPIEIQLREPVVFPKETWRDDEKPWMKLVNAIKQHLKCIKSVDEERKPSTSAMYETMHSVGDAHDPTIDQEDVDLNPLAEADQQIYRLSSGKSDGNDDRNTSTIAKILISVGLAAVVGFAFLKR